MPLKSYLYGVLAIFLMIAIGYVYLLKQSRDKYQASAIYEQAEKDKAIATINKITIDAQKAEQNRATYLTELEHAKNERDQLEKCIADKSCVAVIRVRTPATGCTSTTAPDSSGTSSTMAILDSNSELAYTNLRAGIQTLESRYKLCQATLVDWSKNY